MGCEALLLSSFGVQSGAEGWKWGGSGVSGILHPAHRSPASLSVSHVLVSALPRLHADATSPPNKQSARHPDIRLQGISHPARAPAPRCPAHPTADRTPAPCRPPGCARVSRAAPRGPGAAQRPLRAL